MRYWLWLLLASGCPAVETYTYWIEPCSPELSRQSGCEAADPELAQWALAAWQKAAEGRIAFDRAPEENKARLRLYWAAGNLRLYGETRPILVDGKQGAAIYVCPDLAQLGPDIDGQSRRDRLFRHVIVYLTCLHESGHAIGLPHTAEFADIMYSFVYGGDILEYFMRYRRKVDSRDQIRQHSGISPADQKKLRKLSAS